MSEPTEPYGLECLQRATAFRQLSKPSFDVSDIAKVRHGRSRRSNPKQSRPCETTWGYIRQRTAKSVNSRTNHPSATSPTACFIRGHRPRLRTPGIRARCLISLLMAKETRQSEMPGFIHGQKSNGLFHSICTTCFQTVSEKPLERDLAKDEIAHVCTDTRLSRRYQAKS
jgi:hypothetical protein